MPCVLANAFAIHMWDGLMMMMMMIAVIALLPLEVIAKFRRIAPAARARLFSFAALPVFVSSRAVISIQTKV